MNFANNLKHLRIEKGYTQQELAKLLGKDYSTIGKWELGQRFPVMKDVLKISEIFNVPLETLVNNDIIYENNQDLNINKELMKKIESLNDNQKKAIINIIDTMKNEK